MKTIEKEIYWHVGSEELENGYITLGSKAYGKAIIVLPEGFVVPSKYANRFDNQFDFLTDEKYSDEQILLNYLGKIWSKIIEKNYSNDVVSLINTIWRKEALENTLAVLNKNAKNKNIGTIKNLTVEYYTEKDHEEEIVKASDKTYKMTRKILTEYTLVDENNSQQNPSTNPNEHEQ